MTASERNEFMMTKIRSDGATPYREGGYTLRVLSVSGRVTGLPRSWPIAVVQVGGQQYLCAPNRRRDWVRNLLAAGWCAVEGEEPARRAAALVEDDGAAEVVATYMRALGQPRAMWPFPSDAPVGEIRRHVREIAVFRLGPPSGGSSFAYDPDDTRPIRQTGQSSG
jgi:hypothetical protein